MRRASLALCVALLCACGEASSDSGAADAGDGRACTSVTAHLTPPAGATLHFMDPCTAGQDAECETNLCFPFNAKGPHCSARCTQACECPAPSTGCNHRGVCNAP
jgi:hypothetical protein